MANILNDEDAYIKLCDFGLAKELKQGTTSNNCCGTATTMAPEVIKHENYRLMPDWWSVGIVIYQLMMGSSPFDAFDQTGMDREQAE